MECRYNGTRIPHLRWHLAALLPASRWCWRVGRNSTSFNATGLQKGVTYYFSVTAVDSLGSESTYSNEASKLVQ